MLFIRSRKWLLWGLATALLLIVANHGEYALFCRAEAARHISAVNPAVQQEDGTQGHNTIGIDENTLPEEETSCFLHFSTLGLWAYERQKPVACPQPIQALSGQRCSSVGFMYPLESGLQVKTFCLLRSTQTCCYGPRPQWNQFLLVETPVPVPLERLAPVLVNGTFYVEPKPEDGYVYRMAADSVQVIEGETPDIDPVVAAKRAGLPLFDYAALSGLSMQTAALPPSLRALEGRTVVLAGYCVRRSRDVPPHLVVSHAWWDGVAQGEPPTVANSVQVRPADAGQVPPLWKPFQVYTGRLHIRDEPGDWPREGIVQLEAAHLGAPGALPTTRARRNGPLVPWQIEAGLLACVLLLTLGWQRSLSGSAARPPLSPRYVLMGLTLILASLGACSWAMAWTERAERDTALAGAILEQRASDVMVLLEQGANPNVRSSDLPTEKQEGPEIPMLLYAVQRSETSAVIVNALLERGADPNVRDHDGKTALMFAAEQGIQATARLLMERGASVNARSAIGWTALRYAEHKDGLEMMHLLLEKGADPNLPDANGKTALMAAVRDPDQVRLLLEKGTDVQTGDRNGWTALMFAVQSDCLPSVRLLLQKGAKVAWQAQDGNTARTLAATQHDSDLEQLLRRAAASKNTDEREHTSPQVP